MRLHLVVQIDVESPKAADVMALAGAIREAAEMALIEKGPIPNTHRVVITTIEGARGREGGDA